MLKTTKRSVCWGSSIVALVSVSSTSCVVEPEASEDVATTAEALLCSECHPTYSADLQWCLDTFKPGDSQEDNVAFASCNSSAWVRYQNCLSTCQAPPPPSPSLPQCTSTSQCISWYGAGWQCNSYGNCEYVSSTIDYPMCKSFGQSCMSSFECCNNYCDWWSGTCAS